MLHNLHSLTLLTSKRLLQCISAVKLIPRIWLQQNINAVFVQVVAAYLNDTFVCCACCLALGIYVADFALKRDLVFLHLQVHVSGPFMRVVKQ